MSRQIPFLFLPVLLLLALRASLRAADEVSVAIGQFALEELTRSAPIRYGFKFPLKTLPVARPTPQLRIQQLSLWTAIVFAIPSSRLDATTMRDPLAYVQTPLLFHAFYLLLALTLEDAGSFSSPLSSCLLFLGILGLAAGLIMRRIQRSGEQV